MKAEDFIKRGPICVKPGVSLEEAAKILAQYDIGLVIVSPDRRRELAGVLTERDIVRAIASGLPVTSKIDNVMTRKVIYIYGDTPVWEVARLMAHHHIRHMVVKKGEEIQGVVSIRDIIGEKYWIDFRSTPRKE